jgi:rSAM/selenodomain-associated transferase 2
LYVKESDEEPTKMGRRRRPGMTISVIIPVLHEQAVINETIAHLHVIRSDELVEIVVVDGDADADTLKVIKDGGVRRLAGGSGRAGQMNVGAAGAQGDILLFLHADTRLPAGAFGSISGCMEGGCFVGGAFDLGIGSEGLAFRIIEKVATFRSRLTRIPYGDQAIFIRRDLFDRIGGYKEIPLMEDVELMRRIKRGGHAIFIIPDKLRTSGRRWKKEGVVRCTLRNWTIILLYLMGVSPQKLARHYPPQ